MNSEKTVAFHTLGCKLNFSETSAIARLFMENNFKKVEFKEKADVYVINTCSVTENADKECKQIVKSVLKQSPDAFIAIVGCYAQLKPEEIAKIEGVDVVLGASEKFKLLQYVNDLSKKEKTEIHSCEIIYRCFFVWRQDEKFFKSTGRMRLYLFVLHNSIGKRSQQKRYCK